jgi:Carboxypeptidase regulatory-like domain/TonB-dependent Receptor Plug Domain
VVDSSNAALPGATVNVVNQQTNEVATATTNQEGSYTIPFLRPGIYTLTAEMAGFQKYTRSDMTLQVSQTAEINVTMPVAGVTENVTVSSEAPILETSRADRGTVIDSARIAELPLQSRSPMALVPLVAGVNYNAQAIYLRPFDNGALASWSMNGGANSNNEFLLDGAPNNANQGGNNIAYVPPAAAVQEMKISTNTYDAQYGRTAGGVVNVSLKSGSNSFHGEVYDYMRRKALAANSHILNTTSKPKTEQYIDQYGFSVDGPIFKNKTFFLFTGEKYREGTPAPLVSTVPTAAMKNGDFSGVVDTAGRQVVIYDPATGRDVNGVWTRDPFPGRRPVWRRGSRTCCGPSTSTRTSSGTGWARSITTSARTTGRSSGGARTSGTRSAIEATPSAAVPARPGSCRSGAPTARSSATGCTSSAPGPCSTCAPATPTSWSGATPITRSVSIRRSSGPRASSTRCPARTSAAFSR